MSMKFVYERPVETMEFSSTEKIEIQISDLGASVEDVCESFRDFLKACGYELGPNDLIGLIDTIEDQDNVSDPD